MLRVEKTGIQSNMKGAWGGPVTPYTSDYKIDEQGYRHNIRHCIDDLQIEGTYIDALMGESFCHTIAERKRVFEIAVEEANGGIFTMPYTSDPTRGLSQSGEH